VFFGLRGRIFDNRVVFYLGEISYSIYMVHFPLLRFLTHNYGDWFGGIAESSSQLALCPLAFGVFALLIAVSRFVITRSRSRVATGSSAE
jgi:peptidoglycan/LPS O-acetylase OafA/YrhL